MTQLSDSLSDSLAQSRLQSEQQQLALSDLGSSLHALKVERASLQQRIDSARRYVEQVQRMRDSCSVLRPAATGGSGGVAVGAVLTAGVSTALSGINSGYRNNIDLLDLLQRVTDESFSDNGSGESAELITAKDSSAGGEL